MKQPNTAASASTHNDFLHRALIVFPYFFLFSCTIFGCKYVSLFAFAMFFLFYYLVHATSFYCIAYLLTLLPLFSLYKFALIIFPLGCFVFFFDVCAWLYLLTGFIRSTFCFLGLGFSYVSFLLILFVAFVSLAFHLTLLVIFETNYRYSQKYASDHTTTTHFRVNMKCLVIFLNDHWNSLVTACAKT